MKKLLAWPVAVATLGLAAGLAALPSQAAVPAAAGTAVQTTAPGRLSAEENDALLAQLKALLPADMDARVHAVLERLGLDEDALGGEAINPADYECSPTSPVRDWLESTKSSWTAADHGTAAAIAFFSPHVLDAVLFPQPAGPLVFGANGEYTTAITRSFGDLQRFWDIRSDDIQLTPLRGSMLVDQARLFRFFHQVFGFDAATATSFSVVIRQLANQPQFDYGNHPAFSFNAFAYTNRGVPFPGVGPVPDKILMGDGVLAGYRAVGLDDVAPEAIVAHEFGHHIQYELDLTATTLPAPEAARRLELMADAFAGYYLHHARGSALQTKRINQFVESFAQLGDCKFDDIAHHGTRNQRLASSLWGTQIADAARPQGTILTSLTFSRLFEQKLPELIAPDAG
ncbi:neutral zinc metallopeptidase [Kribbella sp. CA-253562]|uniref:neutral zinc metallopeptidase n=1 Tax=Kribbella sp. CA-253562 TaxID=3239942 RepID=UPI003D926850